MYNIAIISSSEKYNDEYILALEEKKCEVTLFENQDLTQEDLVGMDAVIIEELYAQDIGVTCELIIKIKNMSDALIWVITKESSKTNRIIYLQLGAEGSLDDNMDEDEFSLFLKIHLERRAERKTQKQVVVQKSTSINEITKEHRIKLLPNMLGVSIANKPNISLTRLEYKILAVLLKYPNEAVSYEEIFKHVWGDEAKCSTFRLANLIGHLRKKIEDDSNRPQYIKTVRSKGYMFSAQ